MSLENTPNFLLNFSTADMNGTEKKTYRFKSFRLDTAERQLLNNGTPISLTPKAFDVLTLLVTRAGHLVEKEELMRKVWADSFVEEANLPRIIHTLRKALGEDENGNKFIETVAKQGYRFVVEVKREARSVSEMVDADVRTDTLDLPQTSAKSPTRTHSIRPLLLIGLGAAVTVVLISVLSLTWPTSGSNSESVSIAVLPFRPISAANRGEAINLAFADELINQLSQSKSLKVRSFDTIRKYATADLDPAVIGNERKVTYVLISNYFVDGERVKGTAELYNTATGSIDATFPFEASNTRLFELAETIASSIRPGLLARLNAEPVDVAQKHVTASEEAYRSYLQGMMLANKRSIEDAEKAVLEFENAIRLDPNWASAYVGLAHALQTTWINGGGNYSEICSKALLAEKKALELDPSNGEAYVLMAANVHYCSWDVPASKLAMQRAVELSPNSAMVRRYYAVRIMNYGEFDVAMENLRIARELDPSSTWNSKLLGRILFFAGRYDEAIEESIKSKDLDPEVEQTSFVYMSYELKDDFDKAMEWFLIVEGLKKGTTDGDLNAWRNLYAEGGWPAVLKGRLEKAEASERAADTPEAKANSYAEIARLAVQLGDHEKAFPYIEKAVFNYPLFAAHLLVDPYLDPIRSDPRYIDLLARTWNKHGE